MSYTLAFPSSPLHLPQSSLFKDLVSGNPSCKHPCLFSFNSKFLSVPHSCPRCVLLCATFYVHSNIPQPLKNSSPVNPAFHILLIHEASNSLTLAMSNYHPPSTFGTHFNPNSPVESFASSHDHSLPQHNYPYQNPSFLYSQGQTNGTPIASQTHSNTRSFRSNTQGDVTPSSGNEVNGAPYAPYGGQVQYNVFPTPEDPPMPFAHGVPSYGVRLFNQSTSGSNPPSNPSHFFSDPHPAAAIQGADIEAPDTVPPALSELEDGELDDEEVGKATSQSRASTMTPLRVPQHKRHENLNSADRDSSHHAANAQNKPLPGLNQGRFLARH